MCNGRKHATAVRLQDWLVYIAAFSGCERAHTVARVSTLLAFVLADWHAARIALYALLKMCGDTEAMHPLRDIEQH